jgi:hypothetical protein
MNKNNYHWAIPLTGAVLFSTAVSAEQDKYTYLDSTNRLTLSLRFGLNISGKFMGAGGSFNPAAAPGNGRRTPNGDRYNYDDGYVLKDSTGNALGLTTYWGYDNASQYNAGADTMSFDRSTATGIPSAQNADANPYPGLELTYDRKLGEKDNWHHMVYGVEAAANYMKFAFQSDNTYNATVTTTTDVYQLPGTTPPSAPFQGTFNGSPGGYSLLEVPLISSSSVVIPGATLLSQNHFDANLWGFRLGPYVEFPLTEKLSLHISGGLALGLIDGNDSWNETMTIPTIGTTTSSGHGEAFDMLWGGYLGADLNWQINRRWSIEGGAQFQDIGKYNHSFSGRVVELDLSRSLFVEVGVGYSF